MGISLVKFSDTEESLAKWGVLEGEQVFEIELYAADHRGAMRAYYGQEDGSFSKGEKYHRADEVYYHSPVSRDVQLCCQGLNYADHREESGQSSNGDEEQNLVFMKAASSICGANDSIVRPKDVRLLDYEVELGIALKRDLPADTTVAETDLADYIGGWFLCNDVSARDVMFGAPMLQWFKGKSLRTFCPLGPVFFLPDADDFQRFYDLELKLWLNGELKQSASTTQLIHKPAPTLTELSTFMDLNEGDCVLTGTPGGVLAGTSLKVAMSVILNFSNDEKRRLKFTEAQLARTDFLVPGDVLELEISTADRAIDLGRQKNVVIERE